MDSIPSNVITIDDDFFLQPYTKKDILESIEHMPHQAKCFMAYLCAAGLDLLDEVLHGRHLLREITRIDPEEVDSAKQCAVAFKARGKLRAIGMGANRGRLGDNPFDELTPIMKEIHEFEPTIFSVTHDVYLCIIMLLNEGADDEDFETLLTARLKEVGTPPKKARFLQRTFSDLQAHAKFIHDCTEELYGVFPKHASTGAEIEKSLGTLLKADRPGYVAMIANLKALIAAKTPLTEEGLNSALADSQLSESEMKTVIDQVLIVSKFTPAWDDRITQWEQKFGFAELDGIADRLIERLDDFDLEADDPLNTPLFLLYRCISELYPTEDGNLDAVITPDAFDEGAAASVSAAKRVLEAEYDALPEDDDDGEEEESDDLGRNPHLNGEAAALASEVVPLLKQKLDPETYHALGIVMNGAAEVLTAIHSSEKVRRSMVSDAGISPDMLTEVLCAADFLLGCASFYVNGEDVIPLEVFEAMTGRKGGFDAAVEGIVRLPKAFFEDTAHAFLTLPENIVGGVLKGMIAAAAILQRTETLPEAIQNIVFGKSGAPAAYPQTSAQIILSVADRMYDIQLATEEAAAHRGPLN